MMDRLLIGASLVGVSIVDPVGTNSFAPIVERTAEYPINYASYQQCVHTLNDLEQKYNITSLRCAKTGGD